MQSSRQPTGIHGLLSNPRPREQRSWQLKPSHAAWARMRPHDSMLAFSRRGCDRSDAVYPSLAEVQYWSPIAANKMHPRQTKVTQHVPGWLADSTAHPRASSEISNKWVERKEATDEASDWSQLEGSIESPAGLGGEDEALC